MRLLENFVIQNRSYRRFDSTVSIKEEELIYLIDQARKVASAKNAQPLKYRYCLCEQEKNDIFPLLSWAALLKDWRGPKADERPAAYIVVCRDIEISPTEAAVWCDIGIAAQTILLSAVELSYGGCLMGTFDRMKISEILHLGTRYIPQLIIALGRPAETAVLDQKNTTDASVAYYRDLNDVHHVPKRSLNEILLNRPKSGEI